MVNVSTDPENGKREDEKQKWRAVESEGGIFGEWEILKMIYSFRNGNSTWHERTNKKNDGHRDKFPFVRFHFIQHTKCKYTIYD